jgi:hypothetical protein
MAGPRQEQLQVLLADLWSQGVRFLLFCSMTINPLFVLYGSGSGEVSFASSEHLLLLENVMALVAVMPT